MSDKRRALKREEFLRGTAGLAAAGTGIGIMVPSAFARSNIKKGGILHLVYTDTSAAETTDPTVQTGIAVSQPYLQNLYDRLTYLVPNTWVVQPQLATSWKPSNGGKTWTYTLRKGVKFHNGKTLDSKDVAWSYRHIMDKKNGSSAYAVITSQLASMATPNASTIVFHLKKPNALWPNFTSTYQTGVYPAGVDPKKQPIGTGPFMHVSYKPTAGWQVKRNPHYWKPGLPYLDGIQAVYVSDPNTKVQSVLSGSGQISDRIPFTQIGTIKKNSNVRLFTLPGGVSPDYSFDYTQEPFTDHNVAQAVKIAVNRKTVLQAALQGNGSLTGDVPELPVDPNYPKKRGVPAQNIALAKQLLKGKEVGFDLHTADVFPGNVELATALKQVVAPAGININIVKDTVDTFWSDIWLKKSAFTSYWNHRHPFDVYNLLYRSNAVWNQAKFNSASNDALADAGAATLDKKKQTAIFQQLMYNIATQGGVGIAYFSNNTHVAKKNVMGVVVDPQYMLILEKAWLA